MQDLEIKDDDDNDYTSSFVENAATVKLKGHGELHLCIINFSHSLEQSDALELVENVRNLGEKAKSNRLVESRV